MTIAEFRSDHWRPRAINCIGIVELAGYRLKLYAIVQGDGALNMHRFAGWEDLVCGALPQPATDSLRPGLGFIIMHQAQVGDYLVFGWWDNGNELPVRLFVSPPVVARFRGPNERESFCIWDIDVMVHERDAFVRATRAAGIDADAYLADRLHAPGDIPMNG